MVLCCPLINEVCGEREHSGAAGHPFNWSGPWFDLKIKYIEGFHFVVWVGLERPKTQLGLYTLSQGCLGLGPDSVSPKCPAFGTHFISLN